MIDLKLSSFHRLIKKQLWGYFFIFPATILFLVFVLWPVIQEIITGFYRYDITGKKFIGVENYVRFLYDPIAIKTVWNTIKYVFVIVPVVLFGAILISLIIYRQNEIIKGYVRAVFYIPAVIPSICLTVVWKWLYNINFGLFNSIILSIGGEPVNFLGNPKTAIFSVMVIVITWLLGLPVILFTASLGGIPETLLEAADLEGAGKWKKFWSIIWPLLKPTTLYVMVTLTISVMQVVEAILLTTNGGPYYETNSMLLMIYNEAFKKNNIGYASAIGNIMFVIVFIISFIQFKIMEGYTEY